MLSCCLFVVCCLSSWSLVAAQPALRQTDIFVAGSNNFHTFRIPAIVVATNGALLAFCEGRRNSASDSGAIDLLLKRSLDDGLTWQPTQIILSGSNNVAGNPAPVVDQITGVIFLLSNWSKESDTEKAILNGTSADQRRVFIQESRDNGSTWSAAREITSSVKKPHWRWYASGPCHGIQLTRGSKPGRLLIPANHSDHTDPAKHPYRSHVIYSDDHGQTWHIGGIEDEKTNESTVVELIDGTVLHNMRSYHGQNARAIATSKDAGQTFSEVTLDHTLIEPVCQASILRLSWSPSQILFSNPASKRRENLTIRLSRDEAKTWPVSKTLHAGPSAYSCLASKNDQIFCLYERGEKGPYEKITLVQFPVSWIAE